ncbi:hypothetical protein [Rubellicoccus peritrichatus]|uniref:Uncharacterized protein n=1 Tax=Rubellicoccus peritrichatus TaxID=3080537 RepID=A0AAQ3LBA7_9BACT|nr:hypothetical protein [Puniceicoccus sp. CR14]WOO41379.1 hypothetical protein RZN69_22395 [Puniceicoccus sp. CR14]
MSLLKAFSILSFSLIVMLPATSGQTTPMRTTFTVLSWDKPIRDVYFLDGQERIDITIPNGAPSASYKHLIDVPLTFYRDGPLDAEGKQTRIAIATTKLSASALDPLLLFLKNPDETPEYNIVAVQTGFQNTTKDLYRMFNLSSYNLAAKFDDEKLSLEPGGDITFNSPDVEGPNFGVMIALQTDKDDTGDWKLVYKTFWPYREGRSGIVFITDRDGRPGQISVRRFYVATQKAANSIN